MSKFIVKERRYAGFYRNPYKPGGGAMRFTKWKTVSSHDSVEEASGAAVVNVGLAERAVFYRGKQISDGPKIREQWIAEQKEKAS